MEHFFTKGPAIQHININFLKSTIAKIMKSENHSFIISITWRRRTLTLGPFFGVGEGGVYAEGMSKLQDMLMLNSIQNTNMHVCDIFN